MLTYADELAKRRQATQRLLLAAQEEEEEACVGASVRREASGVSRTRILWELGALGMLAYADDVC